MIYDGELLVLMTQYIDDHHKLKRPTRPLALFAYTMVVSLITAA